MLITVPHTFFAERKYILDVLLGEFLGLDFKVEASKEVQDYHLQFDGKELIIKSAFWLEEEDYLLESFIPNKVNWFISPFDASEKIPVIYGKPLIEGATCFIDVFASSFFMLTRWEEVVIKDRDKHNRFPVEAALAYQQGFLHLPVVNMYVELLWALLKQAGYKGERKTHKFELINTCDVDAPFTWQKLRNVAGRLKFHINVTKKPWLWLTKEIPSLIGTVLGIQKDPSDTYDYLMDWSEKVGGKSYFFFMDYGYTDYDKFYRLTDSRMQRVIKKIKKRGHYIGFHPSYELYNDGNTFKKVKQQVNKQIGGGLQPFGRQHFLRFQVPTTWQVWENAGMEWDSSMTYASMPGFRCGVCYPYSVFNVLTGQHLQLKEWPLIFMEQSCIHYLKHTPEEMQKTAFKLMDQVAKYQGKFVLLWHNSTINTTEFKKYKPVFESMMRKAQQLIKK